MHRVTTQLPQVLLVSDVTPQDGPPALVHADDIFTGQRPGHGADGRTETE